MKHGQKPKDIVEQDFDIITLAGKRAGKAMSPVNPAATLIACKAGDTMEVQKPGFFQRVGAAFSGLFNARQASKGYFTDYGEGFKYPVADGTVSDGVDNDGDAADDYNAIFSALSCVGYDLSNACCISDENARAVAIKEIIDQFTKDYDAFRAGDDDVDGAVKALDTAMKAGKRHSAKDLAELRTAHAALGALLDGIEVVDEAEKARLEKAAIDGAVNTGDNTVDEATKAAVIKEATEAAVSKMQDAVKDAVKAAVEPLNTKISEQETALADAQKAADDAKALAEKATSDADAVKAAAEKSVTEANAAKEKAESELADAITKARGRKAAGGHDPEAPVDGVGTFKERIKENPNMKTTEAIKLLMANSAVATPA